MKYKHTNPSLYQQANVVERYSELPFSAMNKLFSDMEWRITDMQLLPCYIVQ